METRPHRTFRSRIAMNEEHASPSPAEPNARESLRQVTALVARIGEAVDAQTGRIEGRRLHAVAEELMLAERMLMGVTRWTVERWNVLQTNGAPLHDTGLPSFSTILATAQLLKEVCLHVNLRVREQDAGQTLN
jgi:hypothetical protein